MNRWVSVWSLAAAGPDTSERVGRAPQGAAAALAHIAVLILEAVKTYLG